MCRSNNRPRCRGANELPPDWVPFLCAEQLPGADMAIPPSQTYLEEAFRWWSERVLDCGESTTGLDLCRATNRSKMNGTMHGNMSLEEMEDYKRIVREWKEMYFKRDAPMDIILATLFALTLLVSLVGNLTVFFAVLTNNKLRTPVNAFLVNLAVADLLGKMIDQVICIYYIETTCY